MSAHFIFFNCNRPWLDAADPELAVRTPTFRFTTEATALGLAVSTDAGVAARLGTLTTSGHRVHPRYDVNDLGRVCSSYPNLTSLPAEATPAFVADAGWQFTAVGLERVELHALAALAKDRLLREVLAAPDPFTAAGVELGCADAVARTVLYSALYGRVSASLDRGATPEVIDRFADRFGATATFTAAAGRRNVDASRRVLRLAAITFAEAVRAAHDAVVARRDLAVYASAIRGDMAVFTHPADDTSASVHSLLHDRFATVAAKRLRPTPPVALRSGTNLAVTAQR
jgi:hypothetical protein